MGGLTGPAWPLLLASLLLTVGVVIMLMRRGAMTIIAGSQVVMLASCLLFVGSGLALGRAAALLVLFLAAVHVVVGTSVVWALVRHHGRITLRMDWSVRWPTMLGSLVIIWLMVR